MNSDNKSVAVMFRVVGIVAFIGGIIAGIGRKNHLVYIYGRHYDNITSMLPWLLAGLVVCALLFGVAALINRKK